MRPPECPAGHELTRWRNRTSTLRCDGLCGKGLAIGEFRWTCTPCDYDVCESCAEWKLPAPGTVGGPPCGSCQRQSSAESGAGLPPTPAPGILHTFDSAGLSASRSKDSSSATPAQTAQVSSSSWVYAVQGLESVKRDLHFPHSTAPKRRSSRLAPATAEPLGMPIPDDAAQAAQELIAGMPDLVSIGLPAAAHARLQGRRDWLRRLYELELTRAATYEAGGVSAFEAACGVTRGEMLSPEAALAASTALHAKFEEQRLTLLLSEQMEIGAHEAVGMCAPIS